jgi:hypothetical protein
MTPGDQGVCRRAGRETLLQATRLPTARPPSRTVPRRSPVRQRAGREAPPYSWTPGDQAAHRTARPASRTATAYERSHARVRREVRRPGNQASVGHLLWPREIRFARASGTGLRERLLHATRLPAARPLRVQPPGDHVCSGEQVGWLLLSLLLAIRLLAAYSPSRTAP